MKTYKLGNKVRCIVRSFSSGSIGSQEMMFNNQPYTILKDVEAKITFADKSKKSKINNENLLYFNQEVISTVDFYNVEITDKILNLIYSKEKEAKPVSESVNVELVNKKFILPISHNDIYQIFIYGEEERRKGVRLCQRQLGWRKSSWKQHHGSHHSGRIQGRQRFDSCNLRQ